VTGQTYQLLPTRKAIAAHLRTGPVPRSLDVLDVSGTGLTKGHWPYLLGSMVAGSRIRVLLLDPRPGEAADRALTASLWTSATEVRRRARQSALALSMLGAEWPADLKIRFYSTVCSTRLVVTDHVALQGSFPVSGESGVPIALSPRDDVLGRRAAREFQVVWDHLSCPADLLDLHEGDTPFERSSAKRPPAEVATARVEPVVLSGPSVMTTVADRKLVPADLRDSVQQIERIDVLDIAAAAQIDQPWLDLIRERRRGRVHMRVLMLDPDGAAAEVRARESTRWAGDVAGMRERIHRNRGLLHQRCAAEGIDLELRAYDSVPVSRYVAVGEHAYQSFYPADGSGKNVPLVRLTGHRALADRARREFERMWQFGSRPVLLGS
jgi:hypothetical protein